MMRYSEASTDAAYFHLTREDKDVGVIARFTIDGEPVSKARARFTNYGSKVRTYTPAKTLTAERRVRLAFQAVARGYKPEADATYGVTALFFHGTRQRRDVDNMLKLILDGLNGVAWVDDAQVVEVSGRKTLDEPTEARTEVVVYRVGGVQHLTRNCLRCEKTFHIYPGGTKKFCTRECGYAYRREQGKSACVVCGKPVNFRGSKHCSRECAGVTRTKPVSRCVQCGAAVSHERVKHCRSCYLQRGSSK